MAWVLVWDLETVPDVDGFAKANTIENLPRQEIRAAMGEGFQKPMYHSIICIGALAAIWTNEGWRIKALGAATVGERTEKDLIEGFLKKIEQVEPRFVTFNGNSFDLPVLRYRAMLHSIAAPCLHKKKYFHRYSEDSIDLCDVLSGYRSENKPRLNDLSRLMGFDGKSSGVNGSDVEHMFTDGRIHEIGDYCVGDVLNTYRAWLRYELFRGSISQAEAQSTYNDVDRIVRKLNYSIPIE